MKLILGISLSLLALAGLCWLYGSYNGYVRDIYQRRRFPDIPSRDGKLSFSMDQQVTTRKFDEVMTEHRRVSGLLDEAEAKGFDASALRAKLPRVERLAREGQYFLAKVHLNSILLRVPRQREKVRVASGDEREDDYFPEPGSGRKVRPRR